MVVGAIPASRIYYGGVGDARWQQGQIPTPNALLQPLQRARTLQLLWKLHGSSREIFEGWLERFVMIARWSTPCHVTCASSISVPLVGKLSPQGKSEKDIKNLRQEIEILRQLRHENIIQMLDAFETKTEFCVVTGGWPLFLFHWQLTSPHLGLFLASGPTFVCYLPHTQTDTTPCTP